MKYLYLLLLSVLLIPVSHVAYAQNILDQIGQTFNDLTSGITGGNETNQSSSGGSNASSAGQSANQSSSGGSNASSAGQSANQSSSGGSNASSAGQSANQSESGVGSFQELQNLTAGNQELLANNTSIAPENSSLGQDLEREQSVEPENQSNALAAANITQQ